MKEVFCTKCGEITEHSVIVDDNGEIVFTCGVCKHFLKVPVVDNKKDLQALLDEHEAINRPLAEERAKAAAQQKVLAELLK